MASCVTTLAFILVIILMLIPLKDGAKQKKTLISEVDDIKEVKKIFRTKTNVMVIFTKSDKSVSQLMAMFREVAEHMMGRATLLLIDCSDAKKLCKKLKAAPSTVELKHYKDGDYNRDYDRRLIFKSMVNFLEDPTGELPWEEDPTAQDVVHIDSHSSFVKFLKKERLPSLVMFYAPWCGYCKRLKPEFAAAATLMKKQANLVGIDVDKPAQMQLRMDYNITGFPTVIYFEKGVSKFKFGGKNTKEGIVEWLKDPQEPQEPEKEAEWADDETDVVHLHDSDFDEYILTHPSVLVMFYAPWCGHCKKMKPEYNEASAALKEQGIDGILAGVDATKEKTLAETYEVKGFPSVKYFKNGEYAWDFNDRTADKIIEFMKDPKEPPPPPPPEPRWDEIESDVDHLTEESFKSFLKKKKHALVMFYAPWCGHCKKAKPEFQGAAAQFKDDSKVSFSGLDCTAHQSVCEAQEVKGYPTLKYFNYGKNAKDYMGGREEADFVNFMKDPLNSGTPNDAASSDTAPPTETPPTETTPPPVEKDKPEKAKPEKAKPEKGKAEKAKPWEHWLDTTGSNNINFLTVENFDAFIQGEASVLVMFYAPWCGHCNAMKPAYADAATKLNLHNLSGALAAVDATVEETITAKYNVRGFPTLKYFKDGAFAFDYSGERTTEKIMEFMKSPQAPPPPEPKWVDEKSEVNHLTDTNFDEFINKHKSILVMFYAPWCGHCKRMKPAFTSAAAALSTQLPQAKLAAVDATTETVLNKKYEVKGFPTLKYFENGVEKFKYTGGRTEEDLIAFMKKPVTPPSTPAPDPEWSSIPSHVNHLKDSTYSDFLTNYKGVLVMYYAPWCGHCKKAKPEFQEAAEELKATKEFVLAAVDCTSNTETCNREGVKGYPTFKYFASGKFDTTYDGKRKTEDILKFMNLKKSVVKDKKEEL